MTDFDDIAQLFDTKDSILMAAWMLPNKGDLTDSQRRQAMENFSRYIALHRIKVAAVAHQLGTPRATTIGELMKGKWREGSDEHIRKLNMWVEQHAQAAAASLTDDFVMTGVAKAMFKRAQLIRENGTMGLLLGPTGIGKSRCLQAIHEEMVGSIYIRVDHKRRHPKGLTSAIADQVGVRSVTDTTARNQRHYNQFERVVNALINSKRLLILDEAQKLTDDALEALRDLYDETGIPVMLVATKDLHERIRRSVTPDYGQLYSRFDIIHHLTQGHDRSAGDRRPLFTVAEMRSLFHRTPIRLSADATAYLNDVANDLGGGSLRRCKILLRNAARRARKRMTLDDDATVTVSSDDLDWIDRHLRDEAGEHQAITDRRRHAAGVSA